MRNIKDLRKDPVNTIVALGDSCTWGYSVLEKEQCWVNRVTSMLELFQGQKIRLVNQGIGSNVLTPLCPSYEASSKPCGLERLEKDVLIHKPDLLFIGYGLNDSRAGTAPEVFQSEYQKLLDIVREQCPDTLIVLLNLYCMHECMYEGGEPDWNKSNHHVTAVYNGIIEQLAMDNACIFADIYASTAGVYWMVEEDHCHPSILGHQVIANKVFEAIVRNSSFAAATLPKESNIDNFMEKYGCGPDLPSGHAERIF